MTGVWNQYTRGHFLAASILDDEDNVIPTYRVFRSMSPNGG
jgi:hypothetical protein